jgi:hypothetical protein
MALIQVTQDMIDSGVKYDPDHCALANGIKPHLNELGRVEITQSYITFYRADRLWSSMSTPPDCQRFVDTFDRGFAEPFTTRIPIPLSLLRGPIT